MSFKTEFRLLARVKIRLGYYLDEGDESFFDANEDTQKERLLHRKYDIGQDLMIEPTAECSKALANYGLVWKTDNEGFFIAAEVWPNMKKVWKPLPEGLRLAFVLKIRNAAFPNVSNQRLRPLQIPFRYYFTNNDASQKTYPSLSAPILPFGALTQHIGPGNLIETGEYCNRIASSPISQAIKSTDKALPATNWKDDIKHLFVHSGDRVALPKTFVIHNVSELNAILKSGDGKEVIRSISIQNKVKSSVRLDFSTFTKDDREYPVQDGNYQLIVSGDAVWNNPMGKPADSPTVYLFDALDDALVWGLIEIVHNSALPVPYRIQNSDRTLPDATPEFEIRLASRLTRWEYFGRNSPTSSPKSIHALTKIQYQLQEGTEKYPSPSTTALRFDKGQFVSSIYL